MKLFGALFFVSFYGTAVFSDTGCILNIKHDLPRNEPIILTKTSKGNYSLVLPTNGAFRFNKSQEVLFQCTGNNNKFIAGKTQSVVGKCQSKTRFDVFNGTFSMLKMNCTKHISGGIKETRRSCGNNKGSIIEIGYNSTNRSWNSLIQVCYSRRPDVPLYAEHMLYGKEIKNAEVYGHGNDFKTDGLSPEVHAKLAYKKQIQKATFNKIFQSAITAEKYISSNRFLSRGHYAPDGDFLVAAWQLTTYYYINTAPQWQNINSGNWRSLENMIRKAANASGQDFRVVTGSFGLLTLPDAKGNEKEIYLSLEHQLPVPKYWWKAVVNPKTREGIVFVQLNNPFATNDNDMHMFESICYSTGWFNPHWNDLSKGLIRCCYWDTFSKIIDRVPALTVDKVLNFKKI